MDLGFNFCCIHHNHHRYCRPQRNWNKLRKKMEQTSTIRSNDARWKRENEIHQRERTKQKVTATKTKENELSIRMSTNHSIPRCAHANDEGAHQQNETAREEGGGTNIKQITKKSKTIPHNNRQNDIISSYDAHSIIIIHSRSSDKSAGGAADIVVVVVVFSTFIFIFKL